jgi:hypothetical protein
MPFFLTDPDRGGGAGRPGPVAGGGLQGPTAAGGRGKKEAEGEGFSSPCSP